MLVIVPGAGLALFNHPLTFLSSSLDCDSRWLLRAKSLVYLRSLVKPVYKGGESKCLKVALWDAVFLHPWTVSWRQVCPRGQQVSLWGHLPFSLMPFLSSPNCDLLLEEPTSLEQGYNYHCLQEICSVFSVFKQFNGNSIYYMAALKMQIIKLVFSIFPRTHERLAVISTKLEVEKEQNRSLLSTLSMRPVLERPRVGNFNNPLVLNRKSYSKSKRRVFYLNSMPLNNSMETYLTEFSSINFCSLGFRFLIRMILVNLVNFWVVRLTHAY